MGLSILVNDELLSLIKKHAGLTDCNFSFNIDTTPACIETLKCLCNLVYNCKDVAENCCKNGTLVAVLKRAAKFR